MLRCLHLCSFLSVVLFLSACSDKPLSNVKQGNIEQVLHVSNADEPRELDPHLSTGSPESNIHLALYEGLMAYHPKTLEIEPALAKSWEVSENGLVYRFNLRKSAKWSDGSAITADQIAWSFQRSLMPALASEWAYMKFFIKNAKAFHTNEINDFDLVGIRALDKHTIEFTLDNVTPFFIQLFAHPSYTPVHPPTVLMHGAMDQAVSNWTKPENWVGNGPFTLKEWKINQIVATEKNTHYWDAKNVKLNGVHFYPITDQQAEIRAFRSGQVHLTLSPQMATAKIAYYKKNAPESLRITPTYASYYYAFNTTRPPFNDVKVRKALAMAIDREAIVKTVTKAGEVPAYSIIPNNPNGYSPKKLFSYDPDKARILLAEAGFPNGKGFPDIELLYNTLESHRNVALAIQQMLSKNLGINIQLVNQEWKVYLNYKKNMQHDLTRSGWIADYLDPQNFIELQASYSGNNYTGWNNNEYDELISELKRTSDTSKRNTLFERANAILTKEMPILPLYLYSDANLVRPNVVGWYDNVMHNHPFNRVYLDHPSSVKE